MSPDATKRDLRERVRARLHALPDTRWQAASDAISSSLLALGNAHRWRSWMLFLPMQQARRDEVDLTPCIQALLASRHPETTAPHPAKHVCLPRTNWATKALTPVPVENLSADIVLARYSLREPKADLPPLALRDLDVVVVPGLAFDATGARLGRGGGFYDRLLAQVAGLPAGHRPASVGVCLDEQVVESVPTLAHDLRVDMIVTPTKAWTLPRRAPKSHDVEGREGKRR